MALPFAFSSLTSEIFCFLSFASSSSGKVAERNTSEKISSMIGICFSMLSPVTLVMSPEDDALTPAPTPSNSFAIVKASLFPAPLVSISATTAAVPGIDSETSPPRICSFKATVGCS